MLNKYNRRYYAKQGTVAKKFAFFKKGFFRPFLAENRKDPAGPGFIKTPHQQNMDGHMGLGKQTIPKLFG